MHTMHGSSTSSGFQLPAELACVDASELVLLLDIDGVLAPIVDDPGAAAVPAPLQQLVAQAAASCALVGIVTGRTADRARDMVAVEATWVAALHGSHIVSPTGEEDHCSVSSAARPEVAVAAQLAQTVGWAYEDKGGAVSIHFRQRGAVGQQLDPAHVRAQLMTVINPLKVEVHDAKQVLEIKPRGARTKRDAVRLLAAAAPDAAAVVFVGDDLTDLDGFAALDELRVEQPTLRVAKVAVGGEEAPAELVQGADLVLDGQHQVQELLAALLQA